MQKRFIGGMREQVSGVGGGFEGKLPHDAMYSHLVHGTNIFPFRNRRPRISLVWDGIVGD